MSHEQKRYDPTDDPKFARAVKKLVSGVGGKGGLSSISLSFTPGDGGPTKTMKIDAEAAARMRKNCDAVLARDRQKKRGAQ